MLKNVYAPKESYIDLSDNLVDAIHGKTGVKMS